MIRCLLGSLLSLSMAISANATSQNDAQKGATSTILLVLDGFSYKISSDFIIDFSTQSLIIDQSLILNCIQQSNGQAPLNNVPFTLTTNSQFIGIDSLEYDLATSSIQLSSETNDVICDNAQIFDRIFIDGFEG